jgi:hypothetical protein
LCEQCSEGAGARGLPREQSFAHAAVVREHQACRLLAGVAQGLHQLIGICHDGRR